MYTKKIGILGGGQLGQMIIQEAISYNIDIHILDNDPQAPCKSIATSFQQGNITDYQTVMHFGADKDIVSVEIENVNIEALEELQKQGKKIFPQPHILKIIKDKGLQKQFLVDNQFPTSPFFLVENVTDIQKHSSFLPAVNKVRTGGFDGRGVAILHTKNDLSSAFDAPGILEKWIPFTKELSVIVARNENKQIATFPVVECEFNPKSNLVEYLFSPASIDQKTENKALKIAVEIIEALDMIGLLAVEFFLTNDNQLLVNELAPRPHNSGHHTIEGNYTSQFEQYLRAILNLPLGNTDHILPSVMINLVGEEGHSGKVKIQGIQEALQEKGVFFHLYGKKETKPNRKMGHITVMNKNMEEAKKTARKLLEKVKIISE